MVLRHVLCACGVTSAALLCDPTHRIQSEYECIREDVLPPIETFFFFGWVRYIYYIFVKCRVRVRWFWNWSLPQQSCGTVSLTHTHLQMTSAAQWESNSNYTKQKIKLYNKNQWKPVVHQWKEGTIRQLWFNDGNNGTQALVRKLWRRKWAQQSWWWNTFIFPMFKYWMFFLSLNVCTLLHQDNSRRLHHISCQNHPEHCERTDFRLIVRLSCLNDTFKKKNMCWAWNTSRKQHMHIFIFTNSCCLCSLCLCYSIALILKPLFEPEGSGEAAVCLQSSFLWQKH